VCLFFKSSFEFVFKKKPILNLFSSIFPLFLLFLPRCVKHLGEVVYQRWIRLEREAAQKCVCVKLIWMLLEVASVEGQ
jgi:hypothetical protein